MASRLTLYYEDQEITPVQNYFATAVKLIRYFVILSIVWALILPMAGFCQFSDIVSPSYVYDRFAPEDEDAV